MSGGQVRSGRSVPAPGRPFYARALSLRHLNPGGVLCFLFFEGTIALGVLLALAELTTWWSVLVLPVTVAAMVKINDAVAGALVRSGSRSRGPSGAFQGPGTGASQPVHSAPGQPVVGRAAVSGAGRGASGAAVPVGPEAPPHRGSVYHGGFPYRGNGPVNSGIGSAAGPGPGPIAGHGGYAAHVGPPASPVAGPLRPAVPGQVDGPGPAQRRERVERTDPQRYGAHHRDSGRISVAEPTAPGMRSPNSPPIGFADPARRRAEEQHTGWTAERTEPESERQESAERADHPAAPRSPDSRGRQSADRRYG